jgi:major inositol transporter-like SP family MFS transporter
MTEARNVLGLSRTPADADAEYALIVEHTSHMLKTKKTPLSVIRDVPWIRRVVVIGCGLAIVQQATGINTVNYYAPTILEESGLGVSASLVATIAVGVTSVVTTIIGIVLLGFIGRRTMLLIGFAGVAGSQLALSLVFLLAESTTRSYVILACMILFVGFVQMFIGTCVWLLLSEIFPLSIRGFAMGIAVFVLWCTNAIISFAFPVLNSALGSTGTFLLFVVVNLGSWVFVHRFVPETKGTSLEELEERFEAQDGRGMAQMTPA